MAIIRPLGLRDVNRDRSPTRTSSGCAIRIAASAAVGRQLRPPVGVLAARGPWRDGRSSATPRTRRSPRGSVGVPEAEVIVRALRHSRAAGGSARRLPRVGGGAPAGGRRCARRLRAHLLRERRAVGPLATDLGDHRDLRRRWLLLARAHRLHRDDRQGVDVPDRPADRQTRARRGGDGVCARRHAGARAQRRLRLRRGRRPQRDAPVARAARLPAPECVRVAAGRAPPRPTPGRIRRASCRRGAATTTTSAS